MRVMGIDLGTKNIGIAISDESQTIAQSRGAILRAKKDIDTVNDIKSMAEENDVEAIVVGHPINMNGTAGERALDSEKFAELLKNNIDIRVFLLRPYSYCY